MIDGWHVFAVFQCLIIVVILVLLTGILRFLSRLDLSGTSQIEPTRYQLGEKIQTFPVELFSGRAIDLDDALPKAGETVLLIVSPTCMACVKLAEILSELLDQPQLRSSRSILIILDALELAVGTMVPEPFAALSRRGVNVVLDRYGLAKASFGLTVLPSGIVLSSTRKILAHTLSPNSDAWLAHALKNY